MIPDLILRSGTPDDAAVLSLFATRTFRDAFESEVPPDAMARYLAESFAVERVRAELADHAAAFILATDQGNALLGYAKLYFGSPLPEVRGTNPVKLWRLYTEKERQNRGIGGWLLARAVTVAGERGGETLWLTVNKGNTGAVRFYERNGFVTTGYTTFDLGGELHHDFVMEKPIGGGRPRSSSL